MNETIIRKCNYIASGNDHHIGPNIDMLRSCRIVWINMIVKVDEVCKKWCRHITLICAAKNDKRILKNIVFLTLSKVVKFGCIGELLPYYPSTACYYCETHKYILWKKSP